jgi:hypothetical protein
MPLIDISYVTHIATSLLDKLIGYPHVIKVLAVLPSISSTVINFRVLVSTTDPELINNIWEVSSSIALDKERQLIRNYSLFVYVTNNIDDIKDGIILAQI